MAALRELAGGRADLRAEVCGVMQGASEGELHEPLARQAAELCRKAGAGPEARPRWIAEVRRRRDAARMPPFPGGLHGGGWRSACRDGPGQDPRAVGEDLLGQGDGPIGCQNIAWSCDLR